LLDLLHVVGRQEDRCTFRCKITQQFSYQFSRVSVQVRGWFVKVQNLWSVHDLASDQQFATHAFRIGTYKGHVVKPCEEFEILATGEFFNVVFCIGHVAELLFDAFEFGWNLESGDSNISFRWSQAADQHFYSRCFSGAIWSEEAE
jgi:hypothetical protein